MYTRILPHGRRPSFVLYEIINDPEPIDLQGRYLPTGLGVGLPPVPAMSSAWEAGGPGPRVTTD